MNTFQFIRSNTLAVSTGATSIAFNVSTATATVVEGFETSGSWFVAGSKFITAFRSTAAAHDGTYGLDDYAGNDWIYRTDSAAQLARSAKR